MRRMNALCGIVILAGGLAIGCGPGEQQQNTEGQPMPMPAPAPAPGTPAAAGDVEIAFESQPDPPRSGENTFEVMVTSGGQPVTDAEVSAEFFMPAMPEMKMAEMKNSVALTHDGGGRYRGAGTVMMAGNWDVTVRVRRGGQEIGRRQLTVTAK